MRRSLRTGIIICPLSLLLAATGLASDVSLPRIDGKEAVATVNGEPIAVEELNRALGMRHSGMGEGQRAARVSYSEILNRLINGKLILLEARNIGLDELPEVKADVDKYSRSALMQALLDQQTKDIRADEHEVERIYREIVKEYKLRSLLFEQEEDARRAEEEMRSGKDFQEIAEHALAEGTAKGSEDAEYIRRDRLLPEIKNEADKLEVGSTSPVIRIRQGYTMVKLEEIRYPEDPEARERARTIAENSRKAEATDQYIKTLKEQYVKVRHAVLEELDYEAEAPGFQALLSDRRVVAEIEGEEPITAGELGEALRKKFYHGVEKAAERKRVNAKRGDVLEGMLKSRVLRKEAIRQGIDKSEPFKNTVSEYENSVLFGVFLQKVIRPQIRLEEKEVQAYYERNIADFSSPEMMRIDSLVFSRKDLAEEAFRKLREGTAFLWLRANAEGQVDKNAGEPLRFEGNLVVVEGLPEEVRKDVSGAESGTYRFHVSGDGLYYVLLVREVIHPTPQPFDMVKEEIARKLIGEKMNRGLEDYAGELRKVYPVKIFLRDPKS